MTLRSTVHRKPPVVEGGNKARSALTCKQLCRKAISRQSRVPPLYGNTFRNFAFCGFWAVIERPASAGKQSGNTDAVKLYI